jgi:hypothetical protein
MAAVRHAANRFGPVVPLCALALALAGCSSLQDMAGLQRTGYQNDGSYILSSQEQGLGCRALQERSLGLQDQMRALSVRALEQMQQVPNTVAAAWGRLIGSPTEGVPAIAEYNEARAEEAALNATITQKGCAPAETASIRR